jgi:hypothetical protein
MKILGYSISDGKIVTSDGEVCSSGQSYLEFLLQSKPDTIRMMYDLNNDVVSLTITIGLTDKEILDLMHLTKLYFPPYHLRFVPSKLFSIKRPKAFSYFTDASQYVKYTFEGLPQEPLVIATRAKEIGEAVYNTLTELGINPTSLISPAKAYIRSQVELLYNKMRESDGNLIKRDIISGIGLNIYGEVWTKHLETANRK